MPTARPGQAWALSLPLSLSLSLTPSLSLSDSLSVGMGSRAHKVKLGAPHFVDFGRNSEHSPDGRAYLVGLPLPPSLLPLPPPPGPPPPLSLS